jgi:hypothetical protein
MADSITRRIEKLELQALLPDNSRHEEIMEFKRANPIDYGALEKAMRDMHFARLEDFSDDELIAWHAAEVANSYPGSSALATWTREFMTERGIR